MNRFNKIMLLGLLSVVTGATSVKGMGGQFAAVKFAAVKIGEENSSFMAMPNPGLNVDAFTNAIHAGAGATKFISLDASNKPKSHEYIDMDNATAESISSLLNKFNDTDVVCVYPKFEASIADFDGINQIEKTKIATLYACWMIKKGNLSPVNKDRKVQLMNGQDIQLTEAQNTLVRSYFVKANESLLNPSEPKAAASKAQKIAYATVGGLAAAYLSYLAIGNIVYNHADCTDESSSLTCAATSHANDVSVATYEFLTAAAAAAGSTIAATWSLLKQQLQNLSAQQSAQPIASYNPNCSQFDRPVALPTCPTCPMDNSLLDTLSTTSLSSEPSVAGNAFSDQPVELTTLQPEAGNAGFLDGLLWIFRR